MDIEKMERQAAELAEQIATAKAEKAKQEHEALLAFRKAEQENQASRLFALYAEPFGVPRSVADEIYSISLRRGEAHGRSVVESYYMDFAELARVAYEAGYAKAVDNT